ncbi:hypothetical protein [Clostridium sp. JNZ J1-5]|nr:hypothetical protein [Clostridium sp.]
MHNNKNHMKTKKKSNAELRKIFFHSGGDIGIENGVKIDSQSNKNGNNK